MGIEDEANAVGDYWEGHPDPPPGDATKEQLAEHAEELDEWDDKFGEAGPPEPPTPPTVPGPPMPGAGMPAARIGDLCAHGGLIVGPGCPQVLIGNMISVRAMPAMDQAVCPMFDGIIPHVTGTILKGSNTVLIGNFPAARVADPVGPPSNCKGNAIALGCFTVLIGESGGGGGGGGGGGSSVSPTPPQPPTPAQVQKDVAVVEKTFATAAANGVALVERCEPCGQV